MLKKQLKILAVSGSLRPVSSNSYILKAIKKMLPNEVDYLIYDGLATLPHFNDAEQIPETVDEWRKQVAGADAVLFCSPEYAFGVPGALKNALDWAVGSVVFSAKPVALITASSGGEKAHAALLNVLTALGTNIADDLLISFVRTKLNKEGEITDEATRASIKALLANLILYVTNDQANETPDNDLMDHPRGL